MKRIEESHDEDEHKSKRQKTIHCLLCYDDNSIALSCDHRMCLLCSIKHFRKSETCPFCREVICKKEDRTKEFQKIITNELDHYIDHENNKEISLYDDLRIKGLSKPHANEIIYSIKYRIMNMLNNTDSYTEFDDSNFEFEDDWSLSSDETDETDETDDYSIDQKVHETSVNKN